MKRTIKHISLLTALVALFALLTVTAYADEPAAPAPSIDMSYVFTPQIQLTVYVDGEWSPALSNTYGFGDTVILKAPTVDGKVFSNWTVDGSIVSYSNPLNLTMNAHTTIYAVYANAAPTAKPVAGFTSITQTNEGESISFQAIASGDTAGIVYSTKATDNNLKIDGTDVTQVAAVKYSDLLTLSDEYMPASILDQNNCWMLQITPDSENEEDADTVYHARAYVTVGGTTTYGDVKDVKLSALRNGIWMVANPGSDIDDAFTDLTMNTVTFEPNGGVGATMTQAFLPSQPVTLKANTFTREGYAFKGWNTKADGSGTAYTDGQSVTFSNDTTLYAVWDQAVSYTVTFKVANGTWDDGSTADKTVTLEGYASDSLKLTAADIPAVGTKPGNGYKAGSWDVTPSADAAITKDVTYTYTYVQAGIGTIEIPAENEEGNFGAAGLENTAEELKASVLTDDDKAAIAAGKDVAVWLEMKDNYANVASEDKTLVTSTMTQSLGSGYEVGIYLDLTLWKQVEGAAKVPVTETSGKVKVTMTIPENLRKAGVTYKIIRIHNGVATVIDTIVDETTWKLTFETDAFSTYALAYTTAASTTPTATTPTASEPEEESDYLEPLRSKLHAAGEAGGAQTVEYTGSFSLPIEFMTYLKEHPQVTLVYHTSYEGEEFTVTIPGNKAIVDEKIGWYGPLWLRAHYGTGTAAKGTVTAPKTDDTLHGYGFWFILMAAGIVVGAAGFIKKKNGLKNQK